MTKITAKFVVVFVLGLAVGTLLMRSTTRDVPAPSKPPAKVYYQHARCEKVNAEGKQLRFSMEQAPTLAGQWTHACVYDE